MAIAINVSNRPQSQLPDTQVFVEQITSENAAPVNVYIQRVVGADSGLMNPKALRSVTHIQYDLSQIEYAISGEIVSYSNAGTNSHTAVSGTSFKYGLAGLFGGHFQANEMFKHTDTASVTALVGAEINTPAVGQDHPSANDGYGRRFGLDIIARTNEGVANWNVDEEDNFGDAEIGTGLSIRTDNVTNGYFRYGMAIRESTSNSNKIGTAARIHTSGSYAIHTSGNNSVAHFYSSGSPQYGAIFSGTYGKAAIRVAGGQSIAMESTATVRMDYTGGLWRFLNNTAERVAFDMSANPGLRVGGQKVVGKRAAALPPPATDLASAITLLNALRDRLSASGAAEHPLFT